MEPVRRFDPSDSGKRNSQKRGPPSKGQKRFTRRMKRERRVLNFERMAAELISKSYDTREFINGRFSGSRERLERVFSDMHFLIQNRGYFPSESFQRVREIEQRLERRMDQLVFLYRFSPGREPRGSHSQHECDDYLPSGYMPKFK